jgi:hypothetical protein
MIIGSKALSALQLPGVESARGLRAEGDALVAQEIFGALGSAVASQMAGAPTTTNRKGSVNRTWTMSRSVHGVRMDEKNMRDVE